MNDTATLTGPTFTKPTRSFPPPDTLTHVPSFKDYYFVLQEPCAARFTLKYIKASPHRSCELSQGNCMKVSVMEEGSFIRQYANKNFWL